MVESWPSGCSFLVLLAGGPLGAPPATLVVRSRLAGALTGRLAFAGAVSGPLLGVDTVDGGAGSLAVGPLGRVLGLRTEGPLGSVIW
jgi:hypothetical protein